MRIRVGAACVATVMLLAACTGPAGPSEQGGTPTTTPPTTEADMRSTRQAAGSTTGRILVTGPGGSVSVVTPGGGSITVIERSAPSFSIQPTSSPDGTRIAHTAQNADGVPVTVVWAEAGSVEIDFGFSPFFYSWSPDGALLAALGNDGVAGVAGAVGDPSSGEVIGIGTGAPHFLAWSPDGSRLATHRNGARVDLFGRDGTARNVPLTPATFQAPDWVSDGEVLVAVDDSGLQASISDVPSGGTARLVAVAENGNTRHLIEVDLMSQFDLDPARLLLAVFDGPPGSGRMRILELESGAISEVAAPETVAFEWSPDGSRLLTLSFTDGQLVPEVWSATGTAEGAFEPFTPTRMFVNEYLAFWGQYVRTVRLWSPSGDAFVFPASTPTEDVVLLQRLDADVPERVVAGSMAQWLP
jgi:WD40 repeat protein